MTDVTGLTKFVEMCVDAGRPRDGTHQAGFEEGRPAVDQAAPPSHVILRPADS